MEENVIDQDFPLIEQDPEGFCQDYEVAILEGYAERACDLYYNSDNPQHLGLSDYAYDCLVYWIAKKKKQDTVESARIGAMPCGRSCVKLPYLMPSLDKVKIGQTLESFLKSHQELIYSLKIDGVSAMITYQQGHPTHCYLRGNGLYGSEHLTCLGTHQITTNDQVPIIGGSW